MRPPALSGCLELTGTGIVCGMGPSDAPGMKDGISWTIPGKPRRTKVHPDVDVYGVAEGSGPVLVPGARRRSRNRTGNCWINPSWRRCSLRALQEAFRSGTGGANHEAGLYAQPWGFRLQDIPAEVHLWHGGQDHNVPISVGRYVAEAIPNCKPVLRGRGTSRPTSQPDSGDSEHSGGLSAGGQSRERKGYRVSENLDRRSSYMYG